MARIIAGAYELGEKIGAGGGGIVYLGRHIRLNKQVVLKADKRILGTGTETLRREVDLLKGLSHTYIPQVYDFVQEDGVVYTVMDYIQGESLDKLIARQELPRQAQLVSWACQLLEALVYLHSRPPHGILHGDIKPANIMLRPDGEMCLIDFNIALALGEEGAVKVGFSRGYASPEHYGADYLADNRWAAVNTEKSRVSDGSEKTVLLSEKNRRKRPIHTFSGSTTNGGQGILLDVRSDIYSLGATLYHLISGRKPAQDAREVEALGPEDCSEALAEIIGKAMAPQPGERYQTAEDMLNAFRQLHRYDRRAVRHRRRMTVTAVFLAGGFFVGGVCTFIGLKQLEQRQAALTLAEYSANALAEGDVSSAVRLALQAIPEGDSILEAPVTAQARLALAEALGVYDLSDGFKSINTIELPGAPFDLSISPEGTRLAVVYGYEAAVYELDSQERIALLPIQHSALADCLFTDEEHVVYAGQDGVTLYDLEAQRKVWTGEPATALAVSADGTTIAAVNRDAEYAVIYNTADGTKKAECSFDGLHMTVPANDIFADPKNDIFALNRDGSLLAVSFYNGGLTLFDLQGGNEDLIFYEESDYRHFEGGFCGDYFAFAAGGATAMFAVADTKKAVMTAGLESRDRFFLHVDENGIYLGNGNILEQLEPVTLKERELACTGSVMITDFVVGNKHALVATEDQQVSFYDWGAHLISMEKGEENADFLALTDGYAVIGNRTEPKLRLFRLEGHEEARLTAYNAGYEHDEARVSSDGQRAMLFSCQGFCIYDKEGSMLAQEELPDPENIYDQQFQKEEEESWLEVIWYDGVRRCYSAQDGTLLAEESGHAPDKSLDEEFLTDRYRIVSSLHAAPEAYDRKSGRLAATLEKDSYLTYVTQVQDYIITEYISAEGRRYGILLDEQLQKLAYLPELCDVNGDMLIFDYGAGELRQCRIYSLPELIKLGEIYKK